MGTNLTVVQNTGLEFIQGCFDNLAQGQRVDLTYGGVTYSYVANYFGATSNDLVLRWANTRLLGWGDNGSGQLGKGDVGRSWVPVPVDMTGVLAGKTVVAMGTGYDQSLALCSDGTVAGWGYNYDVQLGFASASSTVQAPCLLDRSGVLAGKTVVAIAAGASHGLAICADGAVAAWGANGSGQLGDESTTQSKVPVLVTRAGVLAGKSVVAVAAGHCARTGPWPHGAIMPVVS